MRSSVVIQLHCTYIWKYGNVGRVECMRNSPMRTSMRAKMNLMTLVTQRCSMKQSKSHVPEQTRLFLFLASESKVIKRDQWCQIHQSVQKRAKAGGVAIHRSWIVWRRTYSQETPLNGDEMTFPTNPPTPPTAVPMTEPIDQYAGTDATTTSSRATVLAATTTIWGEGGGILRFAWDSNRRGEKLAVAA